MNFSLVHCSECIGDWTRHRPIRAARKAYVSRLGSIFIAGETRHDPQPQTPQPYSQVTLSGAIEPLGLAPELTRLTSQKTHANDEARSAQCPTLA